MFKNSKRQSTHLFYTGDVFTAQFMFAKSGNRGKHYTF